MVEGSSSLLFVALEQLDLSWVSLSFWELEQLLIVLLFLEPVVLQVEPVVLQVEQVVLQVLLLFLLQQLVLLEEYVILETQTFFFITDDFSDKRCCIKNDRKR